MYVHKDILCYQLIFIIEVPNFSVCYKVYYARGTTVHFYEAQYM